MAAKKNEEVKYIDVPSVAMATRTVCLLGTSPLLFHCLSEKARQELLLPAPAKNRAARAAALKHNPYEEYRNSVYTTSVAGAPTRLILPGGAFRKAIASAALDVPGCSKTQIGRLVRVVEYDVHIYGVPRLSCMIVRMADIKRTPDVRTRAMLKFWACELSIRYADPPLKASSLVSLLSAAGELIGVGDGRNEKGSSLSCGCFQIVSGDDQRYKKIVASGGIEAQDEALANPVPSDPETEKLLEWFDGELGRRDAEREGSPRRQRKVRKAVIA